MTHFHRISDVLHVEDIPLPALADQVGTPAYIYSASAIRARYTALAGALADLDVSIHYAVKANSNQAVIKLLGGLGAGADVVSAGELARAIATGIPADRIVFAGVGKTKDEIRRALDADIHLFSVESQPELEAISEVAASAGKTARIALRVNPDVDAKTHAKITTGKAENKFGVEIGFAAAFFARAAELPGVRAIGLSMHIGSQLLDLTPYETAYTRLADLARDLIGKGHKLELLDLGGGLGIEYGDAKAPTPTDYADVVRRTVGGLGLKLAVEPGRWMVGAAGLLLTRVVYVKEGSAKRFVIVDGAMNDLIRPTLYEAEHRVELVSGPSKVAQRPADLVGPICETGDYLARDRDLPVVDAEDLIAILDAGAYGAVMSSTYNSRPLVPEVLVDGDKWAVIRPRETVEHLIARDVVPDWLA
jgi:diaminopimelate decarboxylase